MTGPQPPALSTEGGSVPGRAVAISDEERPVKASAWYTLAILTLIYMMHAVDRSVMSIVIEPVKAEFGLGDGQIGIPTGLAFGLTYAIAGLPLGYLIDRTNRKNLLSGLLTVWSGCTALCGLVGSYGALVAARLSVGFAEAGGAPTAMSIIGDLFPARLRSTAIAIFWISTALGTAISFVIGSVIAVHHGWRTVFFVAGVPGVVLAILLFVTVREPAREQEADGDKSPAPTARATLSFVLKQPMFVHIFVAMVLNSMMLSGVVVWIASFLIRIHGQSLQHSGLIAGLAAGLCGGFGSFIGGPIGGAASKRWGLPALALIGAATTFISVLLGIAFTLANSFALAVAGLIAFEILSRSYTAPGYAAILELVQPRMRGICISGLQIGTNLIGFGAGPLIIGIVSDCVGGADSIRYGLMSMMAVGLWACVHFILAYRAGQSLKVCEGMDR